MTTSSGSDSAPVNDALHQTAASAQDGSDSEVVFNDPGADYKRAQQAGSFVWVHSPAYLELLSYVDHLLTRVCQLRGHTVNRVDSVRAAKVKRSRKIYIYPADDGDSDAIPVRRYTSSAYVNLISLLAPTKLTVQTNTREKFLAELVQESPVGPAIVFDMGRSLERRQETAAKKGAAKAETMPEPGAETNK